MRVAIATLHHLAISLTMTEVKKKEKEKKMLSFTLATFSFVSGQVRNGTNGH